MCNSESESPISAGPAEELSPAELAVRVAALTDRAASSDAGRLPMWQRVAPPRRAWPGRVAGWFAWCGILVLLAIALLRMVHHDGADQLIWLNAFTLHVYLPAYAVMLLALWWRRWALAAASGLVIGAHLLWVLPDLAPATPYRAPAGSGEASRPVRIFVANVRGGNQHRDEFVDEIVAADPDVIVLVEVYWRWFKALQADPALETFVFGDGAAARFPGEVTVFSKLPLREYRAIEIAGRGVKVADLPIGGTTLRLVALHSPRPYLGPPHHYDGFWRAMTAYLDEQSGPLLVVGDFNATQHSRAYGRLTELGLRSAHTDRGRGYATTWPNGRFPLPPIRIDQAMLSESVECLEIIEGQGPGSDHRPLVLEIQVHPADRPATGEGEQPAPAARRGEGAERRGQRPRSPAWARI